MKKRKKSIYFQRGYLIDYNPKAVYNNGPNIMLIYYVVIDIKYFAWGYLHLNKHSKQYRYK